MSVYQTKEYKEALDKPIIDITSDFFGWEREIKIPILGMGGISSGRDAVEMLMCGATAIGIGSGIHYRGMNVFEKVCTEMQEWMKENNYSNLKELRGKVHE